MAEAGFIKGEEALTRDTQMAPLFRGRIDPFSGQRAAVDQVMNGTPGDGEELGDLANFDKGRNRIFLVVLLFVIIGLSALLF